MSDGSGKVSAGEKFPDVKYEGRAGQGSITRLYAVGVEAKGSNDWPGRWGRGYGYITW